MIVLERVYLGIVLKVFRVPTSTGYQGRPYVALVADAYVMMKGEQVRAWRFGDPYAALAKARKQARTLALKRSALRVAWLP